MRLPQTKPQKQKAIIHGVQSIIIFIAGCLSLTVLTKDGQTGGPTGFFFALCFLSLPAIAYQVVVPIWSRAWRMVNHLVFASIDLVFAILWLAASIAVGVWNDNGMKQGADIYHASSTSCSTFTYGSSSRCEVSKASVGMGVLTFLLFAATSAFSIRALAKHHRQDVVPGMRPSNAIEGYGPVMTAPDHSHNAGAKEDIESLHKSVSVSEKSVEAFPDFAVTYDNDEPPKTLSHQRSNSTLTVDGAHPGKPAYPVPSPLKPSQHIFDETSAPSALSPTGAEYVYASMMKTPTFNPRLQYK